MTAKFHPKMTRQQVVQTLVETIKTELQNIEKEKRDVQKAKLSKDNIQFNLDKLNEKQTQLNEEIETIEQLGEGSEKLGLVLFQRELGTPPSNSSSVFVGAIHPRWNKSLVVKPIFGFDKRKPGERWSEIHPRAEVDEHFHLLARY